MFESFIKNLQMIKRFYVVVLNITVVLSFIACSSDNDDKKDDYNKIEFGKRKLMEMMYKHGIDTNNVKSKLIIEINEKILPKDYQTSETYLIKVDSVIKVIGKDASGLMYGCIDLAERIELAKGLPADIYLLEKPIMSLRGVCILLMKLGKYNYSITPDEYPFFYDKTQWIDYLNFLVANKFNYVALWNGHPFDYFVKLDKYPEAQSGLDPKVIKQNNEMMKWLIQEGSKRNIKFFWEFYNIHTSVYYQKAHNLSDEISIPTKELADYTSYCIEKFVNEFPEVGLYITAGEALDKAYAVNWVKDVILSTVKKTGKNPDIILRSWFLDLDSAQKIVKDYPDIFIESKYNVEMIADTLIDPMNKEWASLTNNFIANIHMAGNLEPFRWNPPFYIQKCLQSSYKSGTNGFHLYPRKSWRWPKTNEIGSNELQWQRDELWFKMWGRYSWYCFKDIKSEKKYWIDYLTYKFGNEISATNLLESFEEVADVLPALQRLFWAGHDNHTVITAGLMLKQIEKAPGIPFLELNSTMRIPKFLNEIGNEKDQIEKSPIEFLNEKQKSCEQAIEKLKMAIKYSTKGKKELEKYLIDFQATQLTLNFYLEKLKSVVYYSLFNKGVNPKENSNKFLTQLKLSVDTFRKLTKLMDGYYDSISDVWATHPAYLDVTPYHWKDVLPYYEKEYQVYYEEFNQRFKKENNLPSNQGLVGIVFGDPYLSKPRRTTITDNLEFDWQNNPPDDGRNWSVLYSGFIKSPVSGDIRFIVNSKQEVILSIDGKKIINKPSEKIEVSSNINMVKDAWYPIAIEYNNIDFKGSNLIVQWVLPGKEKSKIAQEYLSHSDYNYSRAKRALILGF